MPTVHTVTGKRANVFKIDGLDKTFKAYELQVVGADNEPLHPPELPEPLQETVEGAAAAADIEEELAAEARAVAQQQHLRREGVAPENIVREKRQPVITEKLAAWRAEREKAAAKRLATAQKAPTAGKTTTTQKARAIEKTAIQQKAPAVEKTTVKKSATGKGSAPIVPSRRKPLWK